MHKRIAKPNEKIVTFKVTLHDAAVSRELALGESQTLYMLAEAIVDSFDFAFDHCFGFFNQFECWTRVERAYELFKDIGEECSPGAKCVKKVTVAEAFALDRELLFVFDYGDNWRFVVTLTGNEMPVRTRKYPFLISKTGGRLSSMLSVKNNERFWNIYLLEDL